MPNANTAAATVQQIVKPSNCLTKPLLTQAAWGRFSEVASMTIVSNEITAIAMSSGKLMEDINVDAIKASLAGGFTQERGYYETIFSIDLGLLDATSSAAIVDAQNFCDIFLWTNWSDKTKRMLGFDIIDGAIVQRFDNKEDTHNFSFGGESAATNIVTFKLQTFADVIATTVDYASLPLS